MEELFATPKLKEILPRVQRFMEEEVYPIEIETIQMPFNQAAKILDEKRQLVKDQNLWGLQFRAGDGGLGLTLTEFGQISEVLASTPFGHYVFNCQAPDIGNMELIKGHGSPEIKQRYLEPLKKGEIRSCFSMTEPEFAGSNPTRMATTAIRDGDEYIINGHKWFTSGADGAAFAVVMVVSNPEETNPYKRASQIIVPTDNPGFELVRNISIMGDPGEGYLSHSEIRYKNCRVPVANRIGVEGEGFRLAQERLGPGRIHHCMRWIGISERSLDLMCRRAVEREIEDGVPLAAKQIIQGYIAECRAQIDAARLLVLRTADTIDKYGTAAARNQISSIKFHVADLMLRVVDRAIQVHGGLGVTDDMVLSFWYRHERAGRIVDGTDEVHKAALARSILKEYGVDIKKIGTS